MVHSGISVLEVLNASVFRKCVHKDFFAVFVFRVWVRVDVTKRKRKSEEESEGAGKISLAVKKDAEMFKCERKC